MKKILKKLLVGAPLLFILSTNAIFASSDSEFSVTPLIENTNNSNINTYFDLTLKPKQQKVVTISIHNSSNKEQAFIIETNQATTSESGAIDYGQFKRTNKLNLDFEDLVDKRKQEIKIPKNSSKDVQIKITMPKNSFNGMKLGAFHVYKKNGSNVSSNNSSIKNVFAYNIAIVVRNSSIIDKSNLKLSNIKIKSSFNYPSVEYSLNNWSNNIESNLKITSKLYKKSNKKVFISDTSNNLKIAPNSKFTHTTKIVKKYLDPGIYILDLNVKSDKTSRHFTKEINISNKTANAINKESGLHKNINWIYIFFVLIIFILVITVIYLLIRLKLSKRR
ncbi:WxL protein peptidoglycan domain-containing protein [Companilactobacillus sp. DQM5]|uniref:WxL protein peptidoglycan domain-containing protein n=1 Tax=Companilactobacillus sp. DQM5 TaxID=3463359 RepID=UPI00405962E5